MSSRRLKHAIKLRYSAVTGKLASHIANDVHAALDAEVVRQLAGMAERDAGITATGARLADCLRRWRWRSLLTGYCLIANTAISTLGGFATWGNPPVSIALLSSALASILLVEPSFKSAKEKRAIASVLARLEAAECGLQLARIVKTPVGVPVPVSRSAEPVTEPTTAIEPLRLFVWKLLDSNPDKYPHLAIVGESGGGKSFTAARLTTKVFTGKTLVIAPHWKPGDWQGFSTYCMGRNYGSKKDEPLNMEHLLREGASNISVAAFLKGLEKEMDRRYNLYTEGREEYPFLNIIWDEALAALDEIPELAAPMRKLLREARKVGIRMILLIQDDAVESLKIKGQGLIRKNLKYVRLGEFAIAYAKRLKDDRLIAWTKQQEYPCLVEGVPAIVP